MSLDVRRLLDLEEIRALKYAYFRCVDTKDWAGVEACFVPEATASYPSATCADRAGIIAFLSESIFPELVTMHHGHHPEIQLDAGYTGGVGDTASGTWHLHDKVFAPAFDYALEGAALYADTYLRTAQGWRMTHTGYQRLYESTWSTKDVPGLTFEQGAISRGQPRPDAE